MEIPIRKWGNSAAVILPTTILEQLHAQIGDSLKVDFSGSKASLELAKPKYKLADLLAQCDQSAPLPEDLVAWEQLPEVGSERL